MSNVFTAVGNLARDAELKYLPSGSGVLNFVIGNNTGFGDKQKTLWVNCQLFGKLAEGKLSEYLVKGAQVFVSGELSIREFQKKDESTGYAVDLNVRDIKLIGSKQESEAPKQAARPAKKNTTEKADTEDFDDDIPFN